MNLFLWDTYNDGEITEKTKYWADLWEEIIDEFSNSLYGNELVNPHLLLMNLLDEIRYNKLQSKRNNTYFLNKIRYFLKTDKVIKKSFNTDFKLIVGELSQKSQRFEYFILLCEQTIESFQNGIYFKESCDLLKKIILSTKWEDGDENEIALISQNLIIELILTGYSIKEIKKIPQNIFDKYELIDTDSGEILRSKYPLSIHTKEYTKDGVFDEASYKEAAKAEIDSLSISDRINRLKYYFDNELSEGYGIYHIEGLKGNVDLNIGKVNFYSPKIENYTNSTSTPKVKAKDFEEKKLEFYDSQAHSFINAAVKIKYRDFESAKNHSMEIIEKSLDMLRLYTYSKTPFHIKVDRFYLIDCEDLGVSSSFSSENHKHIKDLHSFNLNESFFSNEKDEFFKNLEQLLLNENKEQYQLSSKLIYSLHWYRKGFETNIKEDKLLNYWIAIENLVTLGSKNENLVLINQNEKDKFTLVEQLVPFIELFCSLQQVAIDAYSYLDSLLNSSQSNPACNSSKNYLDLPQECLDACQFYSRRCKIQINLLDFVQSLNLIKPHITKKIIENRVNYADKFYNDNEFTKKEIQRKLEQTKEDLLLIYRYRNFIVHNAHFDNNILPYYVIKAENIAGNLLRVILHQHINDRSIPQQKILLRKKVEMERMIEKLDNNIPVDLWSFEI